ncbi:MAG: hypothetical protein KA085_04120 [Phenylobacterium sp.]|uniref:hypothetical protein n=1 Tax=Phenylobacterium sp. TaxID=1871053 RepID=UPI001B4D8025|nr:hypothetical protein [Phenylobacterium sp.]MBP7815287.1 hypothetical protein [Phenylobacterium sp.]MBP9232941.1 hypothetical protein [Phenylobacterium sp.]MBP9754203.1 hypothetical protein [Phenylobacterium sp.]
MRVQVSLLALMLVALAACSPPAEPQAPAAPLSRWSAIVTGAGTTLAYAPESPSVQTPPIRLSCAREPAVFQVAVEKIIPISSEDRLSVGFDGAPFALAVTPKSLEATEGIEAAGPITQDLLVMLQTARMIQASYGATQVGPYDAPPPAMLASFAQGCRAAGVSR